MAQPVASSKPAMTGSCHCGAVTFASCSLPTQISNCYCRCCSKVHGAAFASFAEVPTSDITWSGETVTYNPTDKATRRFCARCHSPISMIYADSSGLTYISAAMVDEESLQAPLAPAVEHIFVGEKVQWYTIRDDAPQYKTFTPEWQEQYNWSKEI